MTLPTDLRPTHTAFGAALLVEGSIAVPELNPAGTASDLPQLSVIAGTCPRPAEPPMFVIGPPEDPELSLWHRGGASYCMSLRDYATFDLDGDAALVRCDPHPAGDERWQDALVAQAMPFAAVLLGREVFHASAVTSRSGDAMLILAQSGTGKSTLAAHLVGAGAGLLADDAVAVDLTADGRPNAHVGSRWVQLSADEARTIVAADVGAATVGTRAGKTTVAMPAASMAPHPVRRVVLLRRSDRPGQLDLVRQPSVAPSALLGSSLSQSVMTPARLLHQLDVCAAISRDSEVISVTFGPGVGPRQIVDRLWADEWAR